MQHLQQIHGLIAACNISFLGCAEQLFKKRTNRQPDFGGNVLPKV
jgi:hypothetical protein